MSFLDSLFPDICVNCWQVWQYVCKECKKLLRPHQEVCPICKWFSRNYRVCNNCQVSEDFLKWIIIWFNYNWIIKDLIWKLKFKWARNVSDFLADRLKLVFLSNQALHNKSWEIVLTYVPQHWYVRYFKRWYNQSYLLSKCLSYKLDLPLIDAFCKVRHTRKQTKLKRAKRLVNLENAFDFVPNFETNLNGKTLVIVDDITTTWTTIRKLSALVEKKYPETNVWWLVVGRHS